MIRYVLIGDAQSPHLLKWARALHGRVNLWVVSSRGFLPDFDAFLPFEKRFIFDASPGWWGWVKVFLKINKLGNWLVKVDGDWINPHYLSSHGLLAILAQRMFGLRARLVGSAWGSDVLIAPRKGLLQRLLLKWIIDECDVMTSDSHYVADSMRMLCPCDVIVFPFGLDCLPDLELKNERLFFTNRSLEPIYRPLRVLEVFKKILYRWPDARLVIANNGSMQENLKRWVVQAGLNGSVEFVGRLSPLEQSKYYARARWFFSLPSSDAVSVSILEAMSHACYPIVSDLPANRELIDDRLNGLVLTDGEMSVVDLLPSDISTLDMIGRRNRDWIRLNALFEPSIQQFLIRLHELPVS